MMGNGEEIFSIYIFIILPNDEMKESNAINIMGTGGG